MKKFILLALVFATSAFAAEVTVLEQEIGMIDTFYARVLTSMQMDKTTGEGFASVEVVEERPDRGPMYCDQWGRCYPSRVTIPMTVYRKKVKIDGLVLVGNEVVYQGAEGDVLCGKMGVSRIFKRPVLKLNGNCKLSGRITGNWNNSLVVVKLKTK